MTSAPRNATLPPAMLAGAQAGLQVAGALNGNASLAQAMMAGAQAGLQAAGALKGPVGLAANIASAALSGAQGASSLKEAAMGAAASVGKEITKAGTPVAAAVELAQVAHGLVTGSIGVRDAAVQGVGAALDIAAGVLPGPVGLAAKIASSAMKGMKGATSLAGALRGAAQAGAQALAHSGIGKVATTVATGAAIALAGAAGAATLKEAAIGASGALAEAALQAGGPAAKLAQIGMSVMDGALLPRDAMTQGVGLALDVAAGLMPGPLSAAAHVAAAGVTAMADAQSLSEAALAAGHAVAGEALPRPAAALAGIGAQLAAGNTTASQAMSQAVKPALDLAGLVLPGELGKAAGTLGAIVGDPSLDDILKAMAAQHRR